MNDIEAIEVLENGEWWNSLNCTFDETKASHDLHNALDCALVALREKAERDNLQPKEVYEECNFEESGLCLAACCYASTKCAARDKNGNPRYEFAFYDHKPANAADSAAQIIAP